MVNGKAIVDRLFQHTAARRRLGLNLPVDVIPIIGFNTQPPEGGWLLV